MNRHPIYIGIIDEPNDLITEQLGVVLGIQVGLCGLRRIQLQSLTNTLPQHIEGGVGLHDLVHGL